MSSIQTKQSGAVSKTEQVPEWWVRVPAEERQVLSELMRMVRGLTRSRVPEVARAARTWECTLGCFIKVRLMHRRRVDGGWMRVERKTCDGKSGGQKNLRAKKREP